MGDKKLNLFDFGTNKNGEYVNLVEEEKKRKDISSQELMNWVENHNDPLTRIAFDLFISAIEIESGINSDIKDKLEKILATKCYHYGNMKKGLYIFSLCCDDVYKFIFENEKHCLAAEPNNWKLEHDTHGNVVSVPLEDYLLGKKTLSFPALYCHCYDMNGKRIEEYADGERYKEDIRHIVCIKEWQMNKFSKNRIEENKKIKDFYECEFTLPDLIKYWGESTLENEDE